MFLSQQILPCPKSHHRKTLHIDLDTGTIFDGERMTMIACCPLTKWIYTARKNTEFLLNFLNLPIDGPSKLLLISEQL